MSFPLASFSSTWLLNLLGEEGDSHRPPARTVLHGPGSRLRDVPIQISHVCVAQSPSASMRPPERILPLQLRTLKSEAIPGREWNKVGQLIVGRLRRAHLTVSQSHDSCHRDKLVWSRDPRCCLSWVPKFSLLRCEGTPTDIVTLSLSTGRSIYIRCSVAVFRSTHVHG